MTQQLATEPQPRKCGAMGRSGRPCTRPAGWGTDHPGAGRCKLHTGSTPAGRLSAAREQVAQAVAATGWHIGVETDPLDGLLQVIAGAAGQVAHANRLVEAEREGADGERLPGDQPSFALTMLRESQGDLARYCKMALDAGVMERKVRLAERTGMVIAAAIEDAMGELADHFPPEVRAEFARVVQRRLEALERGGGDGELVLEAG